ncbi:hypothetical protein [Deinococcus marmoris]|uniref:Uncharacterized protein n=1 Tax=Deinococcus marmoris TaxID=249408 RepID=A0A1U7P0J5_9DEIO|nr:hypothetical protein [Deinococcus marmoris]OLV17248.1 hypothetical protein BOO71_0009358 [Deinococcus marmoris]OLV18691.1 hypothetical protein BOO71_0005113 [Deinococcus marmoris]
MTGAVNIDLILAVWFGLTALAVAYVAMPIIKRVWSPQGQR